MRGEHVTTALDSLIERCGEDAHGYQVVTIGRDLRRGFGKPRWWIRFPVGVTKSGRHKYDHVHSTISLDDAAELALAKMPPPAH